MVVENGEIHIRQEGTHTKFIQKVSQITFSGKRALQVGQEVLYITERAVFHLEEEGLTLVEIAPGVDVDRDILAHMEFVPKISENLKEMDIRIFQEQKMGLKELCR